MEVISIDSISYVRASQLAKRFKYTTDYIGQLCRNGKIDAKLVGRTWYVNPESLEGHKGNRYVKTSSDDKTNVNKVKIKISRQDVEPVVRKETFRSLADTQRKSSNFLRRIEWRPLKYEVDTADLLPPLREGRESVRVNVEIADSTRVAIKNLSKDTKLVTEALPEISLSGSLSVSSIEEDFDNDLEKDLENIVMSDDIKQNSETNGLNKANPDRSEVLSKLHSLGYQRESPDLHNPTYPVATRQNSAVAFAPASALIRHIESEVSTTDSFKWWLAIIFVSLCVAFGLLFVEFLITATGTGEATSFTISRPIF